VKEATLRDFFDGNVSAGTLAIEVRDAVEPLSQGRRRVHVQDLPAGEEVRVTAQMLVRLCDAVLGRSLPAAALETIAFTILVSEHLHYAEDELVVRVLYDWATPEINWKLTLRNVQMFRDWLTGRVPAPPEPDVTMESLAEMGLLRRISKVPGPP
jgi:hypothetical protein